MTGIAFAGHSDKGKLTFVFRFFKRKPKKLHGRVCPNKLCTKYGKDGKHITRIYKDAKGSPVTGQYLCLECSHEFLYIREDIGNYANQRNPRSYRYDLR